MAGEGARIIGVAHHTCGQAEHCARRQIGVARQTVGAGDFVPACSKSLEKRFRTCTEEEKITLCVEDTETSRAAMPKQQSRELW